jgi:hypothetical protein
LGLMRRFRRIIRLSALGARRIGERLRILEFAHGAAEV